MRKRIIKLLENCTEDQIELFRRLYRSNVNDVDLILIVSNISNDKSKNVISQIERTIDVNRKNGVLREINFKNLGI